MKLRRDYYLGYDDAISHIIYWFNSHSWLPPRKKITRSILVATLEQIRKHQGQFMETGGDFNLLVTPEMRGEKKNNKENDNEGN